MNGAIREKALQILANYRDKSCTKVHNSVVDLRRNAKQGDEDILYPFLNHHDPMVVSAVMYTLFEVHGQRISLRSLIEKIAKNGDSRECDIPDKDIQCMAIELLSLFGKDDKGSVTTILEIAEYQNTDDAPRAVAWGRLAYLYGIEWPKDATELMMFHPKSEFCEQLRNHIRKSILEERKNKIYSK